MAIPGSEIYGWRKNDALNAWNEAKLRIQRRRTNTLQQYGFTADYDAQGNMTNMRVDPTSEHGRLQTMQRSHGQQLDQVQDERIARGLGAGGAGLGAQRETEARHIQGGQQAELGRALSGEMTDLSEAQFDAEQGYNRSIAETDAAAARAAWEEQEFNKALPVEQLDPEELEKTLDPRRALVMARRIAASGLPSRRVSGGVLRSRHTPPRPTRRRTGRRV